LGLAVDLTALVAAVVAVVVVVVVVVVVAVVAVAGVDADVEATAPDGLAGRPLTTVGCIAVSISGEGSALRAGARTEAGYWAGNCDRNAIGGKLRVEVDSTRADFGRGRSLTGSDRRIGFGWLGARCLWGAKDEECTVGRVDVAEVRVAKGAVDGRCAASAAPAEMLRRPSHGPILPLPPRPLLLPSSCSPPPLP
jgi:hypothetical protein